MSKTILVTGGTGMLGSQLLYQLAQSNANLTATYRSESKLENVRKQFQLIGDKDLSYFEQINWQVCDLLDVVRLEEVLEGINWVYHCAAVVSFDNADDRTMVENNVKSTANLVNLAIKTKVERLLHTSSVAAIGRGTRSETHINELSRWQDNEANSTYAKSKYLSELEVWRGQEEGLNIAIVNPSIILGPGDWETGSSALFGKIAAGFKFYSKGVNAYIDVRDVAALMEQIMLSDISGERFVLMSENQSYQQVFNYIADELGVKHPSIEAKPWMGAIVWRLEKLRSWVMSKTPMVTRDTVRASFQINRYSNEKVREKFNFEFIPVRESIEYYAQLYQRSQKK